MDYYAAEQLTRQRHDQLAREARGGQLMAKARNAAPWERARVAKAPTTHLGAVVRRSAKALLVGISWLTGRWSGAKGLRVIGPRQT